MNARTKERIRRRSTCPEPVVKRPPMGCGRCQSAGAALVRCRCDPGRAEAQVFRGIDRDGETPVCLLIVAFRSAKRTRTFFTAQHKQLSPSTPTSKHPDAHVFTPFRHLRD
jgi:hypothetical protein